MMIPTALSFALLLGSTAQAASPAVVTTARGDVVVVQGEERSAAPAPPFVLAEGQTLTIAEGGLVVVLHAGSARQVVGPADLDPSALEPTADVPKDAVSVIDELFSRNVSTETTGASRAGGLRLVRPVPGDTVLAPHSVAWRCDGCGEQQVQLYDFREDAIVWTATGEGSVAYGGPELDAGPYSLMIGGREFAFTVGDDDARAAAEPVKKAAETASKGLDGADAAGVKAAIWLQAGHPSEALWVVDRALADDSDDEALNALRTTYEERAGLAP